MSNTRPDPIMPLAEVLPTLFEKHGSTQAPMGQMVVVSKQIGPETLADSTTYDVAFFIAPCDGAYLKRLYIAAQTKPAGGTNTVNVYRWNGTNDHKQLATDDFDPTSLASGLGTKLTLTSNTTYRTGSAGSVWSVQYAAGAQDTDAKGVIVTAVFIVPYPDGD